MWATSSEVETMPVSRWDVVAIAVRSRRGAKRPSHSRKSGAEKRSVANNVPFVWGTVGLRP